MGVIIHRFRQLEKRPTPFCRPSSALLSRLAVLYRASHPHWCRSALLSDLKHQTVPVGSVHIGDPVDGPSRIDRNARNWVLAVGGSVRYGPITLKDIQLLAMELNFVASSLKIHSDRQSLTRGRELGLHFSSGEIDLLISFQSAKWTCIWQYLPTGFLFVPLRIAGMSACQRKAMLRPVADSSLLYCYRFTACGRQGLSTGEDYGKGHLSVIQR